MSTRPPAGHACPLPDCADTTTRVRTLLPLPHAMEQGEYADQSLTRQSTLQAAVLQGCSCVRGDDASQHPLMMVR